MIVLNEQDVLDRCLECVKQFADEIIVVDTGSCDNTKQIASKYTDKVYDFVWCNDFSKARNFSFSKATCDYVMWLDADDVLKYSEIEKINQLKLSMNADTYMLKYATSFDEQGKAKFDFYRERIIRRSLRPKWIGFVHEVIPPMGKIEYLDITIEHRKITTAYTKRNLNLYRYALRRGAKFDAREQYYYARELFYWGYYSKAIKEFNKFLNLPNKFMPNVIDAYYTLAQCYLMLDKINKAKQKLIECINLYTPSAEIVCELASLYVKSGQYDIAIYYYESALNIDKAEDKGFFVREEYYYLIPLTQLTYIYYKTGSYNKAKYYQLKCEQMYPNNEIVKYNAKFFDFGK